VEIPAGSEGTSSADTERPDNFLRQSEEYLTKTLTLWTGVFRLFFVLIKRITDTMDLDDAVRFEGLLKIRDALTLALDARYNDVREFLYDDSELIYDEATFNVLKGQLELEITNTGGAPANVTVFGDPYAIAPAATRTPRPTSRPTTTWSELFDRASPARTCPPSCCWKMGNWKRLWSTLSGFPHEANTNSNSTIGFTLLTRKKRCKKRSTVPSNRNWKTTKTTPVVPGRLRDRSVKLCWAPVLNSLIYPTTSNRNRLFWPNPGKRWKSSCHSWRESLILPNRVTAGACCT